jgi:4-hydroxybutyrate CoA-transferase
MALYLGDKQELGIQTELIPGGVVDLVEKGVITGSRKKIAPGKVIGSAFAALPPDELQKAHLNPKFELWDFCHTDDLRTLVREENFVAINNALQIDLTGQVTAETLNGQVYSGPGGQTVFATAACSVEGGRSVIAVPSSSSVGEERYSRIVPELPLGTAVTVPRTYVDYVVTEHGIATLSGKTVRERAAELINVAHPDFRGELKEHAKKRGWG